VPEYSGYRFYQRDPRKYALACRMISESLSTSMIARALAISPSTVQAVRLRENISVEVERSRLLDLVRGASRLCVERLTELIPSMSARDAAISAGILIEKQQLLSGEATFISSAKHEQLSHVDFNTLLESLPRATARLVPESGGVVEDKPGAEA
jgi:hypothetical protein